MIQLNTKLTAIAFALSISFSASADHHGGMDHGNMGSEDMQSGEMNPDDMQEGGMQHGDMDHEGDMNPDDMDGMNKEGMGSGSKGGGMSMMGGHCPMKLDASQFEARTLSAEVEADMLFMREEEKLARDVYQALYLKWFSTVHGNIADSEQMHMDRIKIFLDAYGLEDSASEEAGVFNNAELQALYDELVEQGMESELEAYKVGAYIEEVDIKDLEDSIANSTIPELTQMYMQLKNSSYKHLGKFYEKIIALDGEYAARVLSQEAFDDIINAPSSGMMAMGNGVNESNAATNACFVFNLTADEEAVQTGNAVDGKQALNISYQVDVDPSDVGLAGNWIVAATHTPADGEASWFVRDGEQWKTWDGQVANLPTAMHDAELPAMQNVDIFSGSLGDLPGDYSIFTGYSTEENGLVYSPTPLKFSVQP